nr:MAG: hypothetical protein DIU78_03315 [Pseudomonadota bacterium]
MRREFVVPANPPCVANSSYPRIRRASRARWSTGCRVAFALRFALGRPGSVGTWVCGADRGASSM